MKFAIRGPFNTTAAFEPRTARAYCEGRKAAKDGLSVNPFELNRERENFQAWANGHQDYTNFPNDKEYCAV